MQSSIVFLKTCHYILDSTPHHIFNWYKMAAYHMDTATNYKVLFCFPSLLKLVFYPGVLFTFGVPISVLFIKWCTIHLSQKYSTYILKIKREACSCLDRCLQQHATTQLNINLLFRPQFASFPAGSLKVGPGNHSHHLHWLISCEPAMESITLQQSVHYRQMIEMLEFGFKFGLSKN